MKNKFDAVASGTCGYTEKESAQQVAGKNFWRWIGWRAFWNYFLYGASMTIGAALGVGIFYSICVMVLLW
tara:strand:- start:75 stop:284 length:210 start_codon:yes stop_codon:yes gene_type:complete